MQDAKKERSVRVDYEVLGGLNRLFADTSEALSAKWSEQFSLKVDLGLEIGLVRSFRQFAYSQQPPFNLAQLRNRVDHTQLVASGTCLVRFSLTRLIARFPAG